MKVNRKVFLDALTKVKPGIASKEIVEQSDHLIFDDDKIWTYNDEVYIAHKFETGIEGAIKANEFYAMISKLDQEELEIEQDDSDVLITTKNFEANIKSADIVLKVDSIEIPATNSKKWNKLPGNFVEAMTFCIFSASKNMVKPELTCIFVTDDLAVSCDGYRGTKFELDKSVTKDFLIPATIAKHVQLYNPTKYLVDDNWVHFINKENTTFSFRALAAEYPENIWDFFDIEGTKIKMPEELSDIIERVETIVVEEFEQDRFLKLTITKGNIECKGEGSLGWVKESAKIDYKKKERIEIQVHPKLLIDILNHSSTTEVGERLKFKTDNFEHVICLSC